MRDGKAVEKLPEMADMASPDGDDCHKGRVQRESFGLGEPGQHNTFGISFYEHHETGEVEFGKGQKCTTDELGGVGRIRRKLNRTNARNALLGVAADISNFGRLDAA